MNRMIPFTCQYVRAIALALPFSACFYSLADEAAAPLMPSAPPVEVAVMSQSVGALGTKFCLFFSSDDPGWILGYEEKDGVGFVCDAAAQPAK